MKKLLAIIVMLALLMSLVSCTNTTAPETEAPAAEAAGTEAPAAEAAGTEAPAAEAAETEAPAAEAPAIGTDAVETEVEGAGEWDPTYKVALQIIGADEDMLYNGTVSLKSPTMMASEFVKAAVTDKGLAQDGIDVGFVNIIGDYVNDAEKGLYWMYTVNGISAPVGCNQYQLRDGDTVVFYYGEWADVVPPEPVLGDWAFEVGTDAVDTEVEGAGEWDPIYTVNLRIVGANDDVLYNGTVKLKSPTMMTSEFVKAAVTDKGLAQDGIDVGFINMLGDYVNDAEKNIYWSYTVNGVMAPFGCNQYQLRDGDYVEFTYAEMTF